MYRHYMEEKIKLFQKMSVRPSVRKSYVHYNSRTGKDNRVRFFLFERCIWKSKVPKFRPERTKAYEARAEGNF